MRFIDDEVTISIQGRIISMAEQVETSLKTPAFSAVYCDAGAIQEPSPGRTHEHHQCRHFLRRARAFERHGRPHSPFELLRVLPAKCVPLIAVEYHTSRSDAVEGNSVADEVVVHRKRLHQADFRALGHRVPWPSTALAALQ